MPRRLRIALLLALAGAFACQRSPGPPSPEYARARELHLKLAASFADEADGRPEMDEVLALLARVPPDSVDAPSAQDLEARIAEGRRRLAAERADREKRIAAAGPAAWPSGAGAPLAAAPVAPEAEPRLPALAPGLKLDAFRAAYGDCFEPRTPLEIQIRETDGGATTRQGDAWSLKGDAACRQKHPGQAGQVVLFAQGVLLGFRPEGDVKAVVRTVAGKRELVVQGPGGRYQPVEGSRVLQDGGVLLPPGGIPLPDGGRFMPQGGLPVVDGGPTQVPGVPAAGGAR
jgi:hypothetical protein